MASNRELPAGEPIAAVPSLPPPPAPGEPPAPDEALAAEQYRTLTEQATNGIFITDDRGIYLEVNDAGTRLLRLPREQIIGRHIRDFLSDDDLPSQRADWQELVAGHTVLRERRFRRADGTFFPGEISARRLSDGRMLGILRDITARKLAEDALRQSEERFRQLTAAAFEGIGVHEAGRVLDLNDQFAAIFGRSREALLGHDILALIAPESLPAMERVVRDHDDRAHEHFILRGDGSRLLVESQAKTISWNGRSVRVVAVRDITARRQAEEHARTADARLHEVFENTTDGVFLLTVSPEGEFFFESFNPVTERRTGLKREQVHGRRPHDVLPQAVADMVVPNYRRCVELGHAIDYEETPGALANHAIFHTSLIPLRDATGRIVRIAGFARDITDRRRAEAALAVSEERFSAAFRVSPVAIIMVDVTTRAIIDVNAAVLQTFRCTREQLIGHTALELGLWVDLADREYLLAALRANQVVRDHKVQARTLQGNLITVLLSAERMELSGHPAMLVAVHDITAREQAEARERAAHEVFTHRLIAAQESDRRRIAGELHDSLGQNLLLIKNRAQLALMRPGLDADTRNSLESVLDMASEAIAEARRISHDLRPYQVDQLGLTRALEAMIDTARQNTGFPFERKLDPVDDLFSRDEAIHFYRIVQESLTNILKHSRASAAHILLERDLHDLRLIIEDNGRGCGDAMSESAKPAGLGLRNIVERARILGGTVHFGPPASGCGMRTEVVFKLPRDQ